MTDGHVSKVHESHDSQIVALRGELHSTQQLVQNTMVDTGKYQGYTEKRMSELRQQGHYMLATKWISAHHKSVYFELWHGGDELVDVAM